MSLESPQQTARTRLSVSAALVAAGIMFSRISGFIRITLFSYVFGLRSDAGDAFQAALRIPNFLQNLLGEGVLSASLIPIYSALMVEDRDRADRMARAVLAILAVITSVFVLIGIAATPFVVPLIAGGYTGEKLALTVNLVRILFPGIGLLVMSAWCLAILNSHHRFFLSYAAPVCWNAAIIACLWIFRHDELSQLAIRLAWATLAGAGLQLAIQVPVVWRLMSGQWSRLHADVAEPVKKVLRSAVPVVFTRGVVQVSAYVDSSIATWLGTGAVSAVTNAQQLNQLPIALFGMAFSSASLPSMSTAAAANLPDALRTRIIAGQEMITALVVPSMVAFLACGDVMVAMLLEHGKFTHSDTLYVWGVLAGSAVGLLATTVSRLYVSAFYAVGDTTTPTRFALLRVALVGGLGYLLALPLPRLIGVSPSWGAAGLTASAGLAGWVEFLLLRRALQRRIGPVTIGPKLAARAWMVALGAAAIASLFRLTIPPTWHVARGLVILGVFGALYLAGAQATGLLDSNSIVRRVLRRR
ncbi:MAG: murein biosynthesis integral membrane protein MurJ [Acidobacteriota bacterium]